MVARLRQNTCNHYKNIACKPSKAHGSLAGARSHPKTRGHASAEVGTIGGACGAAVLQESLHGLPADTPSPAPMKTGLG